MDRDMKRAEQIANQFHGMTFSGGLGTEWIKSQIAAALREAREEGRIAGIREASENCRAAKERDNG